MTECISRPADFRQRGCIVSHEEVCTSFGTNAHRCSFHCAGAPPFSNGMHSDSLRLNNSAALNGSEGGGSGHLNGLGGGLDGSVAQPMVLGEQPMLYANGAAAAGGANGLVAPTITTGELGWLCIAPRLRNKRCMRTPARTDSVSQNLGLSPRSSVFPPCVFLYVLMMLFLRWTRCNATVNSTFQARGRRLTAGDTMVPNPGLDSANANADMPPIPAPGKRGARAHL